MIQRGSADNWMKVINQYLEIDEISPESLLSFFSPLEDFIDDMDGNVQYTTITAKESELEELMKKIIAEINAPPTSTTIDITSKNMITKPKINTKFWSKQNDKKNDINVINSNKNLQFKSSLYSPQQEPENHSVFQSIITTEVPFNESFFDYPNKEEDKKPKINKAVWAVGAVLIATIVICIIAIFGRQRCRKTPKNRRYV